MGRPGYDEVVLLTGFPSFHARRVCQELVANERTFVHAVVRAKLKEDADQALGAFSAEQRSRINLIDGDAAAMDLGLSGAEFKGLTAEVDRIHHAAHVSYLGVDRKTAEQVNVGGAREVLELARATPNLKALVFHSSANVSGNRTGLVLEEELCAGQRFRNAVEETNALAEKLLRAEMRRVPIVVVRPSIVVGDSQTGEVDRFDGVYLLILLIVTSPPDFALPLPARGDSALNIVPIDYAVRAAVALGNDPRAVGRTFHVVDKAALTARQVFELVARAGGRRLPRGFIPANLTKALLRTPGLERFAKSPRAFLDTLCTPVTYGSRNADELLASTDLKCPPFGSYVDRLVEYVQLRLRERRAKSEDEVHDPLG